MRSLPSIIVCAALASCVPAPAAQPGFPAPASSALAPAPSLPATSPSPAPSTPLAPSEPPAPSPSTLPPSPSPCPDGTPPSYGPSVGSHLVILVGTVVDQAGSPVAGALAHVVSLDAAVPYQATAITGTDGRWVVNNLPAGVRVRVRASEGDRASADVLYLAERTPPGCREPRRREFVLRLEPPLPPPSLAPAEAG